MRKIILIGGDLASGKSTYSSFLAKELNLTLLNKDRLKEIAGDIFFASNREENKKLSVLAFDYIKYFIETSTCNLIIESNFKDYEMKELKKILKNDDVLSLRFTGNNDLLHKRFLERLNNNRHYVHKSQDFSKLEDFVATLDELRKVQYIGKVINIQVDDNYLTDNKELLLEIKDFLAK